MTYPSILTPSLPFDPSGGGGEPSYNKKGIAEYVDTATFVTPISILEGAEAKLTNDQAGAATFDRMGGVLNIGSPRVYDPVPSQFNFNGLQLFDVVDIRVTVLVDTSAIDTDFSIVFKGAIGSGSEWELPMSLSRNSIRFSNLNNSVTATIPVYMGSDDTRTNPAEIIFKAEKNDVDVKVYDFFVQVDRIVSLV